MSKFNSRQIERISIFCIARDGRNCVWCKNPLSHSPNKAQIAHLDGNVNNNPTDYSNYGMIHAECNKEQFKEKKELPLADRPMTP